VIGANHVIIRSLAWVLAMDEIDAFIRDYTTKDRDRVVFSSNGKLGAELRDSNIQHRLAVCDRLRKTGASPASDELVRELYDAETAWANAAWCVRHDTVSFLAAELLTRDGEKNLRHYLECCMFRGVAALTALIDSEGASAPSYWGNSRDNLARNPATE
jgi:hypothetical protein